MKVLTLRPLGLKIPKAVKKDSEKTEKSYVSGPLKVLGLLGAPGVRGPRSRLFLGGLRAPGKKYLLLIYGLVLFNV